VNIIHATWTKGQIIPDQQADWPEGSRLVVQRADDGEAHPIVRSAPKDWLPGFWEQLAKGWQGEPLVRPEQGEMETRDRLQ
jgi:hypothetical protein